MLVFRRSIPAQTLARVSQGRMLNQPLEAPLVESLPDEMRSTLTIGMCLPGEVRSGTWGSYGQREYDLQTPNGGSALTADGCLPVPQGRVEEPSRCRSPLRSAVFKSRFPKAHAGLSNRQPARYFPLRRVERLSCYRNT